MSCVASGIVCLSTNQTSDYQEVWLCLVSDIFNFSGSYLKLLACLLQAPFLLARLITGSVNATPDRPATLKQCHSLWSEITGCHQQDRATTSSLPVTLFQCSRLVMCGVNATID